LIKAQKARENTAKELYKEAGEDMNDAISRGDEPKEKK
jgi:hypothetical protein